MEEKKVIKRKRVRRIEGSFSWIDHRFITQGFLNDLSNIEILLYLFLVSVSDRYGLSFYHDDRICNLLKIDMPSLGEARQQLIMRSLLAYERPIYQVLSLPPEPIIPPSKEERAEMERQKAISNIRKIREALL